MKIGITLKKLRRDANLTQKTLADKCNMSRGYLADLEADRYNPSIDTLKTIADALGVSVNIFFNNETSSKSIKQNKDNDILRIERARNKMSPKDKEKMMKILEASFEDYFDDEEN